VKKPEESGVKQQIESVYNKVAPGGSDYATAKSEAEALI